jgi:hypothetical protein
VNDQAHHRRPSNHFKKHWGNPAICIFRPSSYDWRECEALCRNNRQIWGVIYSYYTDILWIMTTYYDTSSDIMIYHVLRYIMMYYDILWYIMLCILHVYIYMYMFIYIYICTCFYVHIYIVLHIIHDYVMYAECYIQLMQHFLVSSRPSLALSSDQAIGEIIPICYLWFSMGIMFVKQ